MNNNPTSELRINNIIKLLKKNDHGNDRKLTKKYVILSQLTIR